MKNYIKTLSTLIVFLSFTAINAFSIITTNSINDFAAPNGSIIIYANVFDTATFKSYISSVKIVDKKGKTLFDGPMTEHFSWLAAFDGRNALFVNAIDEKIAVYKVKGGSFDEINKLQVNGLASAYTEGKITYIFTASGLNVGLMAYNKTLSKKMFEIPQSNQQFLDVFANGVVAQLKKDSGTETVTYTKKGKLFSKHDVTVPAGYIFQKEVDQYGGLLYWFLIGKTNSPITYLNKKGKKIPESFDISNVAGSNWVAATWSGKNFYAGNMANTKIFAFKIGKKSALLNSIDMEPFFSTVIADKSKVFISNFTTPQKAYASSYDKNLKSQKWKNGNFDYTAYLGKGTLVGGVYDGINMTVTIFKSDKKIIATHTYKE